jgi:hypothetical protein
MTDHEMDGQGSVPGNAGSVTAQWISHCYSIALVMTDPTSASIYLFNNFKKVVHAKWNYFLLFQCKINVNSSKQVREIKAQM